MKKNVMMRVASLLMVCVLATTCGISGTFAKYVTSDSVEDTARVAKFGVVVTADGELFSKTYKNVANSNVPGEGDVSVLTVVSSDTDKVVAPGTQSNANGFVFTLTGDPEVDVQITIDFTVTNEIMLAKDTAFDNPTTGAVGDTYTVAANYYPIIFTLKKDGATVKSGNAAAIKDYFDNDVSGKYEANEMDGAVGTYVLTWAWAFQNTVATPDVVDVLDTYLGNQAAAGALADMEVSFSCTVEQID